MNETRKLDKVSFSCVNFLTRDLNWSKNVDFDLAQYFRTLNTRVSVVYIETWASENQALVDRSQDLHRALLNFNDYISRKLYKVEKDTTQLLS